MNSGQSLSFAMLCNHFDRGVTINGIFGTTIEEFSGHISFSSCCRLDFSTQILQIFILSQSFWVMNKYFNLYNGISINIKTLASLEYFCFFFFICLIVSVLQHFNHSNPSEKIEDI